MRKIINECYDRAKKILKENEDLVKLIAETLLEVETLTKEQIDYLVKNGRMPEEDELSEETKEIIEEDDKEVKETKEEKSLNELREEAKEKDIKGYTKMNKEELQNALNKKEDE